MNSSSSLRVQGDSKYTSTQQSPTLKVAILKFLRLVAGDTSLESEFSQVWVLREFQLGDNLTSYGLDEETEDSSNFIYLICQGRVRLLAFDATIGRLVSTQLLLAEQTFGADHLFSKEPLAYRAIAASTSFVAQISISHLRLWLQRIPNLENHLQQLALERQTLIFFKSRTELRSLTSLTLQQLLPYLVETKINAGSSLVEAAPPTKGRFWLASGEIQNLSVGESWGYPDVTIPGALTQPITQTDLSVYHLPAEHWESVIAFAPQLFPNKSEPVRPQQCAPPVNSLQISPAPIRLPNLTNSPLSNSKSESPLSIRAAPEVDFPQHRDKPWSIARLWRPYPFIQQQSSSDCGAACLAMISQYWGKRLSLNTLRNLARVDRMGSSLQGLAEAAQTLGYEVLPIRASLNKLDSYYNPWIAHWQGIHYVVVWRVKGDRILISDPVWVSDGSRAQRLKLAGQDMPYF